MTRLLRRDAIEWDADARGRRAELAGPSRIEGFGMELSRAEVEPGAEIDAAVGGDGERMLYVIAGTGTAIVGSDELALAPESVLWLQPGEGCRLAAGAEGLAVLGVRAPA